MVQLYNTVTRKKEEFVPRDQGKVSIYVCGPTTYNYIHLGNARPLVVFDTIRRYFAYRGYKVKYIQNFTDIDDKIINRAKEEGEDPINLARKYIEEFFVDSDALNVMRADVHPKVSEHLPEIIGMIERLISRGHAYQVDGDVYFDISSYHDYGKLSGRTLDEMHAGARVDVDQRKHHPMDFALWKSAKEGEPAWESPWGSGRPGWHIECSAMSLKYLGNNFDIHGGGHDLIFPHHENEIAQTEAATGQPFVRYWMHNGFITVNQEKMSKSLDNFFLVREILAKFPPETVRFFLLSTHYRSPLDFDDEKLEAAGKGLERIKNCLRLINESEKNINPDAGDLGEQAFLALLDLRRKEFETAMDDDFNTALAIGGLFELVGDINSYLHKAVPDLIVSGKALAGAIQLIKDINSVLGLFPLDEAGDILLKKNSPGGGKLSDSLIGLIVKIRQDARSRKDWATSDNIRDGLKELGITLEDTPQGPRWKR